MMTLMMIPICLALCFAPLLRSVINKTKAFFAGRKGPPWLQPYRDIRKLLGKDAVYSKTTTWLFRAGPLVSLTGVMLALTLLPMGSIPTLLAFPGDFLFLAYLLAQGRLFVVLAALDTGSSFEAMGASREVQFGALTEPVLLLAIATLSHHASMFSLSSIYQTGVPDIWSRAPIILLILALVFFVVLLSENSRMPVDDPTTHLELTMIHEVMVLDHGGPDLAFIEYMQALKLWIFSTLIVGLFMPSIELPVGLQCAIFLAGMGVVGVAIGLTETMMARLRMEKVPQLIVGAGMLSVFTLLLEVF